MSERLMDQLIVQMQTVLQNMIACSLGAQNVLNRASPEVYDVEGLKALTKDFDQAIELMGRAMLLVMNHKD